MIFTFLIILIIIYLKKNKDLVLITGYIIAIFQRIKQKQNSPHISSLNHWAQTSTYISNSVLLT